MLVFSWEIYTFYAFLYHASVFCFREPPSGASEEKKIFAEVKLTAIFVYGFFTPQNMLLYGPL